MKTGKTCPLDPDQQVPPPHTFAEKLRQLREAAGITRYELAKRSGLSKQSVYKIEEGERKPTFESAVKLAEALGVDVSVFVVKPPDAPSDPSA